MEKIFRFMMSDNWLERRVFAPLFEDAEVTLPRAIWLLAVLVGVLGWIGWIVW